MCVCVCVCVLLSTLNCRWCKGCIMKYDHHCVAINNCVGMHNYKYFCLLLLHSSVAIIGISCALVSSLHAGTILALCGKSILSSAFGVNAPQSWHEMAA